MALPRSTVRKILIALMILGFGMALLGLVGELRGWWNAAGEVLMTTGTLLGALAGVTTLTQGATGDEVSQVAQGVGRANESLETMGVTLHRVDDQLGSVDDRLGSMDEQLGSMDGKLDKLDKLDSMDGKLDKLDDLDRVQVELDAQTGVLDRQVELLAEIRDAL